MSSIQLNRSILNFFTFFHVTRRVHDCPLEGSLDIFVPFSELDRCDPGTVRNDCSSEPGRILLTEMAIISAREVSEKHKQYKSEPCRALETYAQKAVNKRATVLGRELCRHTAEVQKRHGENEKDP
ncbi:hypothetical protein TNCV_3491781 [Trichonephila clavipes]|nr:hypothetical protein TNCV_3491781 [Trichonephila clavipes]